MTTPRLALQTSSCEGNQQQGELKSIAWYPGHTERRTILDVVAVGVVGVPLSERTGGEVE